ncbi:hypothetical protein [Cellulosilyticum ruminicola]|nr:hypothetical protein [Cellulosilyticum ruminicola]
MQIPLFKEMKMQEILLELRTEKGWRASFKEADAHNYHNFMAE